MEMMTNVTLKLLESSWQYFLVDVCIFFCCWHRLSDVAEQWGVDMFSIIAYHQAETQNTVLFPP